MTKPYLSICIATYNRAGYIGETLESIISQVTDEVEIVIVDGASTDGTSGVVKDYAEVCKQIRYIRLLSKGGSDQDFCKAVELAKGEYCWLMSDDDILKQGAIQTVLDEIQHNNYSLIIMNSEVRNADLSKLVDKKLLQIIENKIYTPEENENLFIEIANYLSFIGCVIIKRELWNAREKEKYFGTVFVHVGVIFQSPLPGDTLVIAKPLISIRYGNALWTAKSFEIWMFKWPNLIWSFSDYPEAAKRQVIPREPWRKITTLLTYRAKGAYSLKEYSDWLEPRFNSWWGRLAARTVAQLPGCVVNLLGVIYFSVFYHKSRLPLSDIKHSHYYYEHCVVNLFEKTLSRIRLKK